MYLSFQTPVDGYLLVYLLDYTTDKAYCLLPYKEDKSANVAVKRDKNYLFFKQDAAPQQDRAIVDEYRLTCTSGQERNDLYIIFSQKPLTKANGIAATDAPRETDRLDFQKWLSKLKSRDSGVEVEVKALLISTR